MVPEVRPRVFVGPIAAGEKVIASTQSEVFQFLRENYGDAIAVEMEGLGFLEAARANQQVSAIVVRGISDLIKDKNLKDPKKGTEDQRQREASHNASAFAFEVLAKLEINVKDSSKSRAETTISTMNPQQKQRLEQRKETLQAEWNIRNEKLGQLRLAYAIEAGIAIKFQLDKQIQDEEKLIGKLEDELTAIEQSLHLPVEHTTELNRHIHTDIDKLQQESKFILSEIRTDIGGLTLNRTSLVTEALKKLSTTLLLEIGGAPGVGKSSLLKALVENRRSKGPAIGFSGDRITGAGWNGYASYLQLSQPLDKLLLELSNGAQTTIFIDGIDRIIEREKRTVINDLFRALAELSVDENNSPRWLVVYSAREENIQDVYRWLNWQVLGTPVRLQVPELTLDELKRIAEHSPNLKPLLYIEQLSSVLKNPLMLSLLEDARMLPNSEELPPITTEIEISKVWWERMVGDEGSVIGHDRKNSLLRVGRQVVRSPGKLFPTEDHVSPESIVSLKSDRILSQDPERELYRFSHDLLEDWVLYRVLDQRRERLSAYLLEIGEPFGLYRAVQLLGMSLLENSETADSWIELLEEIEGVSELSVRWRQALLTAPLLSLGLTH